MNDVTCSPLPPLFGGFPYEDSSTGTMSSAPSPGNNYSDGSSDCLYLRHNVSIFSDHQTFRPLGLPAMNEPRLVIREQPVEKFRFRYKSEMLGTHGSILGRNSDKSRKKTFPTVELMGYKHPAVIRCSLYTAGPEETCRTLHAHRLIVRVGNDDKDDPHDCEVSQENGFVAVFQGMGIIHTARKNITDELIKRKRARLLEEYRSRGDNAKFLSTKDELTIKSEAENEGKKMSLNTVCLCFEAFHRGPGGQLRPICERVFSQPINNMKSALTGELKICRIDKCVSSCLGGEEVFILVEKVGKKNIKIKFFELDDEDNEIWYDFAKFSELDVHHQYAIVFRTPPYRHTDIEEKVDVYLQLYRPTDGECSEPIRFQYNPADKLGRKRQRTSITDENVVFMQQMSSYLQQQQQQRFDSDSNNRSGHLRSDDTQAVLETILKDAENGINSSEFKDFFMNLSDEYLKLCSAEVTADCASQTSGTFRFDRAPKPSTAGDQKPKSSGVGVGDVLAAKTIKKEQVDEELLARQTVLDLDNLMAAKPPPNMAAEVVAKIFEQKSDEGNSALQTAILFNQDDLLKQMLVRLIRGHHCAILDSKNHKGETALHLAVELGQDKAARELMRAGADPNLPRDEDGATPLHLAVLKGDNSCLEALLDWGDYLPSAKKPDCALRNHQGCAALHVAVRQRYAYAVERLAQFGADVNQADGNDRTALHLAVEEQDLAIAEFLLKKTNIRVDSYNMSGYTALHVACANDNAEMVKMLLDAGADPHLKMAHQGKSKDELEKVDVEVKLEPQMDYEDEEEDDDEEEEEEEEEEDEDSRRGENSSFDLASNKILELFKDMLKPQSVKEEEDDAVAATENRLFDPETLERLCDILDASRGWVNLADLLDYGFLLPNIRNSASPSKLLFNYADIHGNVSVQEIRAFLEALDEDEAIAVLDAMLERRGKEAGADK